MTERQGSRSGFFARRSEARHVRLEEETRAAKEYVVGSWEKDRERNPEGLRAIRGKDGKPAEIVLGLHDGAPRLVVNGDASTLLIGNMRDISEGLAQKGLLQGPYEFHGTERFSYIVKGREYPLTVLTARPASFS